MKHKHRKLIRIKGQGNGMYKVSNQKKEGLVMIKYDSVLHNIASSNLIYKSKIQKKQQNKEVISRKTKRLKLKTVQRKGSEKSFIKSI